ncbi:MAG TPA: CRISPR-associated endonuclease Cas1 [Planctomycetes bacterium]|nr:CRISPR-associated endonuclease Cas1 [Planctomycetota bacterium]
MLNEFCYCPRLAYLEWVQGEFADNLETREGRFAHRRVDGAQRQPVPAAEEAAERLEPIHSRSVMLSAPREGLIARIDVLDLQSGVAVPVDYKRGKVPEVPGGAWEPEQVQLCAQALVLRENGYHCEGGIIYYAGSRRRVSVPIDDQLVERTRQLLGEFRRTAASGRIPPPLEDSPKCPRCSLVGICLPDETRLLAAPDQAPADVRRLVPARPDALPVYVQHQGATLGKQGDQLVISSRGRVLRKVKMIDVSQVCLLGNVQLTAQALRRLTAAGIPIAHFSYSGWFHALTSGLIHKNVELRMAQFAAAADPERALKLACAFVAGKIKNARTILRRNRSAGAPQPLGRLRQMADQALAAKDLDTLLGIEGMAAREYFAGFARLLKDQTGFHIEGRNRRPPRDPVNALLSFVYAMLVKDLTITLHTVGLDPMLGFLHRPRYGRPSLALDLAEEFRPLIGDSVVLTLINNKEVTPDQFTRRAGAVAMNDAARRAVISAYERRMDTLVTHPTFGYRVSYRRVLEVQARLLGRTLIGEIARYASFSTR